MYSSANWIPAVVLWMQPWPLFMVIARLGCLYPSKWDWVQLDRSSLNQLDCRGSIDVRLDITELPELAEANLLRILVWTPSPLSSQFTGHILTPARNLNWIPSIPAKSQYTHPPTSDPPMGFHGSLLSWDKLIFTWGRSQLSRGPSSIFWARALLRLCGVGSSNIDGGKILRVHDQRMKVVKTCHTGHFAISIYCHQCSFGQGLGALKPSRFPHI